MGSLTEYSPALAKFLTIRSVKYSSILSDLCFSRNKVQKEAVNEVKIS